MSELLVSSGGSEGKGLFCVPPLPGSGFGPGAASVPPLFPLPRPARPAPPSRPPGGGFRSGLPAVAFPPCWLGARSVAGGVWRLPLGGPPGGGGPGSDLDAMQME